MPLQKVFGKLHFRAPPLGCLLIGKEHSRERIPGLEIVPVVINLSGNINHLGEFMGVFYVHKTSLISGTQTRVVEAEIQNCLRGGIDFLAAVESALNTEIMKSEGAEKAFERVAVHILGDPIGWRRLEFFVEQSIVTLAVINCAGKQHFQAIRKSMAISDAALVSVEARDLTRNLAADAGHVSALARNDIDHAEEGVVAIETRTGTADDFD